MSQKSDESRPGFKQEAIAVLGIFFSIFLFLSLVSADMHHAQNWCGEIGKLISHVLLGFTGWGAYLLVGLTLAMAVFFFSPKISSPKY